MSDTERRVSRPIEETDKVITAAFNRFKEGREEARDIYPSLETYDDGVKVVSFGWIEFDGSQRLMRSIKVRISESHLEIWATINGLVEIPTRQAGVKLEWVGMERLPIFTSGLEDIIEDAFDLVNSWNARDLAVSKLNQPFGKFRFSSGNVPQIAVKDFVDGN